MTCPIFELDLVIIAVVEAKPRVSRKGHKRHLTNFGSLDSRSSLFLIFFFRDPHRSFADIGRTAKCFAF